MATEDITLQIKLDDVKAALRQVPTLTQKEFNEMEKVASKTLRKVGKEAEKALKDAEKAAEKAQAEIQKAAEEQMQAVGKVGDMFTGGLVGDLEDITKAFGPVGLAAAAAAGGILIAVGAVGALGQAIVGIQEKAEDTIDRLDELGMAETISQQQRDDVTAAKAAFEAMDLAIGKVAITLAANFSPDIQQASRFVQQLTDKIDTYLNSVRDTSVIEEFGVSLGVISNGFWDLTFAAEVAAKALGMAREILGLSKGDLGEWGYAQVEARKAAIGAALGIDRQRDSLDGLNETQKKAQKGIDDLTVAYAKEDKESEKAAKQKEEHRAQLEAEKKARQEATAAAKAHAEAVKKAAEEERLAKEILDAQKKSLDDLTQMWNGYVKATQDRTMRGLSDQDKITAGYEAELQKIRSLTEAAKELATTQEQVDAIVARGNVLRSAATDEYVAKLEELDAKIAESGAKTTEVQVAAAETALQIWADYYAEVGKYLSEQLDKFASTYGMIIDKIGQIGQAWEDLQRQRLDAIMEERMALIEAIKTQTGAERAASVQRLKATRDEANETRQAVAKGFRVAQAAAVAAAIVDAARSAVALIPAFSFLGPGAPFAAAGVAGSALAIQLATIKGQQPKFHSGLDPSETPAIITRGEGVANARAMSQPGFAETLRAANAGLPAQSSGPVVIALNDRILAQLDARTQRVRGRVASGNVVRLGTATHYG